MLRKFSARNFRCFKKLDIEPLARVNLIVGENNVGKTALLEALYLNFKPGNPDAPWRINHSRGVRGGITETWDELGWLFNAKATDIPIELQSENAQRQVSLLRIRFAEPSKRLLVPTEANDVEAIDADMLSAIAESRLLKLEYTSYIGEEFSAHAYLALGGMVSSSVDNSPTANVVLVLKNPRFSEEHAKRYSALVELRREQELLPSLQALDPRIQRVELLYRDDKPMLHVDIGNGQLVPLLFMGEGIGYVASWQLAIMTAKDGCVLIDEFENGIHYSALEKVWKAVGEAARDSNVQVFATTHSWECVVAAQSAFAECGDDDFRLHRLERRDGDIVAITYDQEQLATSIELNLEVR